MKLLKNLFTYQLLIASFILALLNSCEKDKAKPSWDVDLLLPLIADTIVVQDVLDERFFVENPDQSISIVFNEELFSMNIDSLVELPDTLFHYGMRLSFMPLPTVHQPGDTILSQRLFLPINLQYGDSYTLLLEKAILRTGSIVFEAYQESDVDLLIALGITGADHPETGSFFEVEEVPNNETFHQAYDISDYHLNLTGPDHDTVNMFTYDVALIVHPDELGEVTVYPEDSVALSILFKDVVLNYSRGYFDQSIFHIGPDVYPINIFEDIEMEGISFDDAEINFLIENTYGVDVNVNMEHIIARNNSTQETVVLESDLLGTDLFVDRAIEVVQESGEIESHHASFNFTDSNFPELLSINPDEISYKMSIETNVNGDSTSLDNFFYYDHPISVGIDARVKGGVKIDSLFQSARMEWNTGDIDLDNISEGQLNLIFSNAFPFDFIMNLYFEDEEMNIIDTLVFQQFIEGGKLDENYFVSDATETRLEIPLDDNIKSSFQDAKYTVYELIVSSANGEHIMIHTEDYLKFKVVGDFKYLLER
ncbi:MAG: hypothetical protein GQ527_12630 [Bacteroidales bacterium]|nr:hypothetical protein [Bacteroidales bacterium]